ncbi:uncharacterized protein LOC131940394 [Physella acuta]|uniref:uncharacterized protein LOC131940394 n=1 Tax=Physella acuta TaxID=109671 RepID=UPI0027DC8A6A|nr:uncharacterized protein LOC131940394 [Physella acuta]
MESDVALPRHPLPPEKHYLTRPTPQIFIFLLLVSSAALYFVGPNLSSTFATVKLKTGTVLEVPHDRKTSVVKYVIHNETEDGLACAFPHVNPFDPEIMKLSGLQQTALACDKHLPDLTYLDGNKLVVNTTQVSLSLDLKTVSCKYQDIFKDLDDDKIAKFGEWSRPFNNSILLGDATEFIRVVCENSTSHEVSKNYYALIPKRERQLKIDALLLKKYKSEISPKEILNVLIIGFDGVSRHHFLRAMSKTYSLLMNDFSSFDFTMHTQVGINTFPNFIPLLTGTSEDNITKWWTDSDKTDAFDFIWKAYEKSGYRTLYTEDFPSIGAFHYAKVGFLFPPTTYYSHPISVAIDSDKDVHLSGNDCLGSRPEFYFHIDYIRRLYDTFPEVPKFAMAFLTRLTHDVMNDLKKIDDHTYEIYTKLSNEGYLNNTLLITFSDHGPRWGPIRPTYHGMIESKTPYTILTFPKWFLKKYPDVVKNLRTNTGRLTTHYDTHATLMDLLHFKASGEVPVNKGLGISLFQEIPKNRTCEDAHIPSEYCVCGQKNLAKVDVGEDISKTLAENVVDVINTKSNRDLCAELSLDKIIQVLKVDFSTTALKKEKYDRVMYKIRLQTVPGHAIFEATAYHKVDNNTNGVRNSSRNLKSHHTETQLVIEVGENVERLNLYRGQADCVTDSKLMPFCFCRNLLHTQS